MNKGTWTSLNPTVQATWYQLNPQVKSSILGYRSQSALQPRSDLCPRNKSIQKFNLHDMSAHDLVEFMSQVDVTETSEPNTNSVPDDDPPQPYNKESTQLLAYATKTKAHPGYI